jgi:signal transduction histidine kinase
MTENRDIHQELLDARARIADLERELGMLKRGKAGLDDPLPDQHLTPEEQIKYFVRHLPVAVAMFDQNMNYLMVSDKYLHDYKIEDIELIGKCHYDIFPRVPQKWKDAHKRCLKGVVEACEEDLLVTKKSGNLFIDWVITPWYDGNDKIGGLILFAEIVNEKVEAKRKLLKLNHDLRQSFQQLEEFAFAVSHTLQDPLQSTLSFVGKIGEFLQKNGHVSQQEDIDYLEVNVLRMQKMLNGLLQFAMVGNHQGKHTVSLGKVVRSVMDNLMYRIKERNVKIKFEGLPSVKANEFELITVFQNLISNSIKFNHSEEVRIEIRAKRQDKKWRIEIQDNGDGIPASVQADMFKPNIERKPNSEASKSGVGLIICKNIIESQGGEIGFETAHNQGTTFFFTLNGI